MGLAKIILSGFIKYMKINNNLSFGQKIPTEPLLKRALDINSYSDAKEVYCSVSTKFPGHQGYNKKALEIVEQAQQKNKFIADIIKKLKSLSSKEEQLLEIKNLKKELGENIDITL